MRAAVFMPRKAGLRAGGAGVVMHRVGVGTGRRSRRIASHGRAQVAANERMAATDEFAIGTPEERTGDIGKANDFQGTDLFQGIAAILPHLREE